MKYKSIILNNDENYQISFIKYNENYKEYLEDLKCLDEDLVESVIEYPEVCELSDYQSYMIFLNEKTCIGAINMIALPDEKDLDAGLQLNEEKFKDELDTFISIDQIITLLGKYNEDKENIEIQLLNDIDLALYNEFKYKKTYQYQNSKVYICSNPFYDSNNLKLERK